MASPRPLTGGPTDSSGAVAPTSLASSTTMEGGSHQTGAPEGVHMSLLQSPKLESASSLPGAVSLSSSNSGNNSGNVTAGTSGVGGASASTSAAATAASTSAASAKKKKDGAGGPPKSKAYANPLASRADEIKYRTKYKQLRGKVKEVEEENAKMQAKILRTKRQIQRLRLERSILYDRFQEAKNAGTLENTNIPVTSLQAQLSSVPYSMNGSTSMHHHLSPSRHQSHVMTSPQQQHHQSPAYQHSMSQGYHPSQFTTHSSFLHDNSDSLMITALQHDMQDPTMGLSL